MARPGAIIVPPVFRVPSRSRRQRCAVRVCTAAPVADQQLPRGQGGNQWIPYCADHLCREVGADGTIVWLRRDHVLRAPEAPQ